MSKNIFNFLEVFYPFTEDLERRVYGRELARELDMNQKTVQNRLNALEERGLLKSLERGRTKEFALNKESVLTRKLLVAAEISKFHDLLSSSFEVKEIVGDVLSQGEGYVIIYGSFARDDWKEESDLDLLLIDSSKEDRIKELGEKYPRGIHFMFADSGEFIEGMKSQEPYMNEILEKHVICRGFEEITDWRFEYG